MTLFTRLSKSNPLASTLDWSTMKSWSESKEQGMRKPLAWLCALAPTLLFISPSIHAHVRYGSILCQQQGYYCYTVRSNQSWESLWSNPHDRGIVMRVNRMNTHLWPGEVIAVPNNLSTADIMDFSPFPHQMDTHGEKVVIVDPNQHAWGAYAADGSLLRWGPASLGADFCNDIGKECRTSSGSYRVFTTGDGECYSRKFPLPDGGAPMPYCMYFSNGEALHGEPRGLPGYNASHGCVRMYVSDAEWMRYEFINGPAKDNKFRGTKVVVRPYASNGMDDIEDTY